MLFLGFWPKNRSKKGAAPTCKITETVIFSHTFAFQIEKLKSSKTSFARKMTEGPRGYKKIEFFELAHWFVHWFAH